MQQFDFHEVAENVAENHSSNPVAQAMDAWLESEGHRENIEGAFDLTGIGMIENEDGAYFFTQIFAQFFQIFHPKIP